MTDVLRVRDLELADIEPLVRYWTEASPEFLRGMGVDPEKLLSADQIRQRHLDGLSIPDGRRDFCVLVWELNGEAIGATTLANIRPGDEAEVHLHLWKAGERRRGLGTRFMKKALEEYFRRFRLERILCQPAAANPAPNGVMRKLGLAPVESYQGMGSPIMMMTEINRYEITPAALKRAAPADLS